MTTFLWILAVIGAVLFALALAVGLGRMAAGPRTAAAAEVLVEDETAWARDNAHSVNAVALFVVLAVVGGIVALVLGLSLS